MYTIEPFVRGTDEVIDELQRKTPRKRRPEPQHKRVRADLLLGKVPLFLWLADELCRRNPEGTKPVVFLSDGERVLHDRQREYLPEGVTCILDLLHVLERAGRRWHPDGAQAMLDLPALYLNGEWEAFWSYHVEQEDEAHPAFEIPCTTQRELWYSK